jgi:hypothetical protein
MTLTSFYLLHQYKNKNSINRQSKQSQQIDINQFIETKLLKVYLRAHCHDLFNGVYEMNSSIYLPYTLSALFNLFDFSDDPELKYLSNHLIDRIIYLVLLCCTYDGVCNLTPSCRSFVRTRTRTHDHNINQLMNIIVGRSPDNVTPSAITDFILTTLWRPKVIVYYLFTYLS